MKYEKIHKWLSDPIKCSTIISQSKWFIVDNFHIYLKYGKECIDNKIQNDIITIASILIIDENNYDEYSFLEFIQFLENEFITNTILVQNVVDERFQAIFERKDYIKLYDNNYVLMGI